MLDDEEAGSGVFYMSFGSHVRVKAEPNNAVDRSWYQDLVRSYSLLAALEEGLKAVSTGTEHPASARDASISSSKAGLVPPILSARTAVTRRARAAQTPP